MAAETGATATGNPGGEAIGRDSALTIMAIGVLVYVGSTMLHEAVGHGTLCLATGGRITLLDPLGMRCSVVTPAMVAAGPLANLAGGALAWLALRKAPRASGNARYFLWLSMVFDLLIAAGYMVVSGATGFGDWAVLAAPLAAAWVWRAGLVLAGIALYYGFLRLVAVEYDRLTSHSGAAPARLRRLALFPTLAAAVVAGAAAALSPTGKATALELAFGTTVVVGVSLLAIPDLVGRRKQEPAPTPARITPSVPWTLAALVVAAVFVAVIGPGIDLSGR